VSPWLAALPYACDRWEASAGIREALASGAVVLCNRYVSANMGHQGAKLADEAARGEFFAWVARLEYEVFGVPRPDVQVWLDVPVSVSLELIRARGRGGGRPEEDIHQTEAHLVRARASYEQMTRQFGGWVRVACCGQAGLLAPETISDMIWERIGEKLE
jgi:dTMP kinase